ncbi:MAG: hydrogenase maturation protease [Sulfuricella sp.]|nr:hydrogenase maturation protease [Sulfuricella sp.]
MAATAIICLGNRYVADDDVGCRVFDCLIGSAIPQGIEIFDGGLCGLDLLRLVEGRRRVVFVDALAGVADAGDIVVLNREQVAGYAGRYGHGAGLPYLLRLLPQVCAAPLPEIALVGAEGAMDEPAVRALAERSMEVAIHGAS